MDQSDKINQKNKASDYRLRKKFGITLEDYNNMVQVQNSRCAICNTHVNSLPRILYVDHDHSSNKVRGLICQKCNSALGLFKDNIAALQASIFYLQKHTLNDL